MPAQLTFFLISAKETQITLLNLILHKSVTHRSKLLNVFVYFCALILKTKCCVFRKIMKINMMRVLPSLSI